MLPKVLVGIPTYGGKDYCLDLFITSLKAIEYPNKDVLFVDNSDDPAHAGVIRAKGFTVEYIKAVGFYEKIVASRNLIRQKGLEGKYDFVFFLDSDVFVPPDVITKLVVHGVPVVSGVCFTIWRADGVSKVRPVIFKENTDNTMIIMNEEVRVPGLYGVKACGGACVLVRRDVLEKVSFSVPQDQKTSEDILFCLNARKQGFSVFADTSVQCKHSIMYEGKNVLVYLGEDKKMHVDDVYEEYKKS